MFVFFWAVSVVSISESALQMLSEKSVLTTAPCKTGSFRCGDSQLCLEQKYHCNGIPDCPNKYDEDPVNCSDRVGGGFDLHIYRSDRIRSENGSCEIDNYPMACKCRESRLNCNRSAGLTRFPGEIQGNLSGLYILESRISFLPTGICKNYTELENLHLSESQLEIIEPYAFKGLKRLKRLFLEGNKLGKHGLSHEMLAGMDNLMWLRLERNSLNDFDLNTFATMPNIDMLDLSINNLKLNNGSFPHLPKLRWLYIDRNKIENLSQDLFRNLPALALLNATRNRIKHIHPKAFRYQENLTKIDLSYNLIEYIDEEVFANIKNLTNLILGRNPLSIQSGFFQHLQQLQSINFEGIDIANISSAMFIRAQRIEFIYFKRFHYCRFVPHIRVCKPNTDGVSSIEHLLVNPVLRLSVWLVAALTCLGNAMVLMGRLVATEDNKILSVFIKNLSATDFLMGIYLLVIGAHDHMFREHYNWYADAWMSSWGCKLSGTLAMTSSETSVLIMVFMSVERFVCIISPFGGNRLTTKTAILSMACIWMMGLLLALAPVLHWRHSNDFYGSNGMCVPLHIDDPFIVGWQYSAFLFLGINLLSVLLIIAVYLAMFISVQRTRKATTLMVNDKEFAIRFFFIVFTDFLCWIPIIVLKFVAIANIPIRADLYAWVVVFILPINSAINPFLYTFTTTKFRNQAKKFAVSCLVVMSSSFGRKDSTTETITISSDLFSFKDARNLKNDSDDPKDLAVSPSLCYTLSYGFVESNSLEETI